MLLSGWTDRDFSDQTLKSMHFQDTLWYMETFAPEIPCSTGYTTSTTTTTPTATTTVALHAISDRQTSLCFSLAQKLFCGPPLSLPLNSLCQAWTALHLISFFAPGPCLILPIFPSLYLSMLLLALSQLSSPAVVPNLAAQPIRVADCLLVILAYIWSLLPC